METPDNKELITVIRELLKSQEAPYEVGSWENFSNLNKSKKQSYAPYIGVAAALLLVFSIVPYLIKNNKPTHQSIVKHEYYHDKKTIDLGIPKSHGAINLKSKPSTITYKSKPSKSFVDTSIQKSVIDTMNSTPEIHVGHYAKKTPLKKRSFTEFLRDEVIEAEIGDIKKMSRWSFGVELAPTVLQSKVNIGAGLTTEYKLSKSLSLTTGISYVALDAGKNVNPKPVSLLSNKKLVSVEANISAIDIPILLTYNINKKLYTSVGISYFNILSEKRNNKYVTELEVSSMLKNSQTGIEEILHANLSKQNIEVATELPLDGNSYLGFFNFSIGHKQEVFKNYNIVIEPFIKIPIGKLSNEDFKLSNGGFKLRFSF